MKNFDLIKTVNQSNLGTENYNAISITDALYPKKILETLGSKAPKCLYYKGNYDLLTINAVGFCGSRNASEKGLITTEDCASQIAKQKLVVISGNANGIDLRAHYSALKNGGSTIFVLPEGIKHFRIKNELQKVWDWSRTLVLSQYEPDATWQVYRAMERNKLIVALSNAMIVIEAGEKGGTLDAGKTTFKLHKPLYVAIYKNMQNAPGNNLLLEAGATVLSKSQFTGKAKLSHLLTQALPKTSYEFGTNSQLSG